MTTTRNITPQRAADMITRAYSTYSAQYGQGGWMPVAEIVNRVDLTLDEITAGVRHLMSTERFHIIPESNQKTLTAEDRAHRLWIGNQWRDLIAWQ